MYRCGEPLGDLDDSIGKTLQVPEIDLDFLPPTEPLQIYCPAQFLSHRNSEVIARNVWGSHPAGYTDDSDVVASAVYGWILLCMLTYL